MVDESDIDNYFKKESKELKDLLGATPDRYLHFKRTTDPLTDDDRAEAEKLISELNEARLAGASKDEQKAIEKKIQSFTFRPQYEIQLDTSELVSRSYSEEQVQEVLESIGKGKPKDDESGDSRDKTKDDDESGDSQEKTEDKRGPQYDLYVKRKKQKNEKPLDQEQWEARVMPKAASVKIRELATRLVVAKKGLEKIIQEIVKDVKKELGDKYEGYEVEYDVGRHDFYIRLKGGASSGVRDITTLKKVRKMVEPEFKKHIKAYDTKYDAKVTASSRGDDLVIHCSVGY